EFMALQKYPSVALEFDMARWLNTCQFHWSSTRHHYQAFVFLQFIKEQDGISMINRMWNESNIGEHPLETYKRLKGIDQEALNDMFGEYAMRNVNWDYEIGDLLRERASTLESKFVSHLTFIPEAVDTSRGWYRIPNHLAPQDYGYNIIRLYPESIPGCDQRIIHLRLEGQFIFPGHDITGWRFGLVARNQDNQTRYSPLYQSGEEIVFELEDDEQELFLVVTGAPQVHHNYAWEIGFPRIYRYPYEFIIENAWPEGFQPGYRKADSGIPGAPHSNGGGFVANTASVDATAYVGPKAQVLDQARVTGDAKILDYAIIRNNAFIGDSASISGRAIVGEDASVYGRARVEEEAHVFGGCTIYDDTRITGNSLIFFTSAYDDAVLRDNTFCWGATLYGDIVLGGDAEFFSECSDGTYLQVEHAYGRHCDGLDDHPANENLTALYYPREMYNQYKLRCDTLIENVFEQVSGYFCEGDTFYFNGVPYLQPGTYQQVYEASNGADSIVTLELVQEFPLNACLKSRICAGDTIWMAGYPITEPGSYQLFLDTFICGLILDVSLIQTNIDTTITLIGNTLWTAEQSTEPDLYVCFGDSSWTPALQPTYQWFDCETGLPIPGADQPSFTPVVSGYYSVRYTTNEVCDVFSGCYAVSTVSVIDHGSAFQWHIQPNPAHDVLQLALDGNSSHEVLMELLDMTGHRLFRDSLSMLNQSKTIDVDGLPPGSYVIKLTDASGASTAKVFQKI
ncbi:MAG TPA: DUF6055 domain-containing protein, partial [Saprospiraceae bacterium]|nr:DUF6055 domain-containing protein [Saprospiraceae bacterium]